MDNIKKKDYFDRHGTKIKAGDKIKEIHLINNPLRMIGTVIEENGDLFYTDSYERKRHLSCLWLEEFEIY